MPRLNLSPVQTITIGQRISRQEQGLVMALPFDLPDHVADLTVSLHPTWTPPYVVDFGLADPHRIRGWSGGARTHCYIGPQQATPGYLSGALDRGTWSVLLGLYRLPPEPLNIEVTISWRQFLPQWVKGDLHVHTLHSDGAWTVDETLDRVLDAGLDFVALSDHNTQSQNLAPHKQSSLVVIPAMEWTTYRGHANIFGIADPLPDWRVNTIDDLDRKMERAVSLGAYVCINHPFDSSQPGISWDWGFDRPTWIEVWNGPWRPSNQAAVDWWQSQLREGRHLVAVSGSDTHGPGTLVHHGQPTTWVFASALDGASILSAINEGHAFMTYDPHGPELRMHCGRYLIGDTATGPDSRILDIELHGVSPQDRIRLISQRGVDMEALITTTAWHMRYPIDSQNFIRVEIHRYHDDWEFWMPTLISNPIYFV